VDQLGLTLDADDCGSDGSVVTVHPLSVAGVIGPASYTFKYNLTSIGPGANGSQINSNPHEAIFEPSGQFMFVPDRGADRLYVYRVGGPHDVSQIQNISLPLGTGMFTTIHKRLCRLADVYLVGPRHATFKVFNSTRTYMYLVGELDNTVRVFTLDGLANSIGTEQVGPATNITIQLQQTISTLGLGSSRTAPDLKQLAAEVALSNDGRFAYVSNRNTVTLASDTLAIFAVDSNPLHKNAHLTYLGYNETYGKTPRHFALSKDPSNQYVAVGNEVSQSLVLFKRNTETGFLTALNGNLSFGPLDVTQNLGPTCILWA